ncbi:gastrin-releasing peptide isoform X2 [Loxodonta africana]|uniref:gastrin-releasing peptide isoform X2 n=1 Tax=Loxodonta africana TaxID=9785 RepID=UPI0002233B0F|nr:gastrin-releasing peptide isoform X2 [Loxodonta africana]
MCGRELPLVLLALVLCPAPGGQTAPAPAGGGPVLTKMYPRGNHWAVGHLMGKKSTGEPLYVDKGGNRKQQLREHKKWEEAARTLLGLIEAKGNRSSQPSPRKPLGHRQPTWESEDSSNFKDLADFLLQVFNVKENTHS